MVAIADAALADPDCPYEVVIVIADVPEAGIIPRAVEREIEAKYIAPGKFRTKLDDDSERSYITALQNARVDYVVLAGFMRILKGEFLRAFSQKVINIHPALLPSFPGLESWKQALDYGVKFTGCTVHFVDHGIDTGPIIAQQTVPVLDNDTPVTLHARIQEAERLLYPAAVKMLCQGSLRQEGRRCLTTPSP
jgi:phosphoribosylglycinamide formyltransferase-1